SEIDGIINQGGSCVVSNNVFHGVARTGILCQNMVAEGMRASDIQYSISGNTLSHVAGAATPSDGGSGISIQQGGLSRDAVEDPIGRDSMAIGGVTISGNNISDANDAGIYINGKAPFVDNVDSGNNGTNSIMKVISVTGNTIKNQFATEAYAGIRVLENADGVVKYGTIVGNVIEMDATTSGARCIELVGTPQGFAISANTTIKGDVAVHLNSAVDVSVTGNVFLETGSTGDYVNSTSATGTIVEANNLES
ncbi:MAG: hypothetical protein QF535_18210, partial [Anaerolineales bacterium]|nr:hypothetical protein [Anaerolineales bacterium]